MKTTKPIATITYNSVAYLYGVLKRLEKDEILTFWCFIQHEAEEDENKAHIHLYMEPNKQVDLLWLRKQFLEPDPKHPKQPLGALPIHTSKWVDWYWYGLHDRAYLASKGQTRKYHYDEACMVNNDPDYFAELVRTNPNPKAEILRVAELMSQGYNPLQIATMMNVPLRNLAYFVSGLQILAGHVPELTDRNGREGHEENDEDILAPDF